MMLTGGSGWPTWWLDLLLTTLVVL